MTIDLERYDDPETARELARRTREFVDEVVVRPGARSNDWSACSNDVTSASGPVGSRRCSAGPPPA